MKTGDVTVPLNTLRALCRYQTHGGYTWAGVMYDGECMCVKCLRDNYRHVFASTRDEDGTEWELAGATNSGEADGADACCHCHAPLWSIVT